MSTLSSPRHIHELPPELTDRIIDHLQANRYALEVCSLVCERWRPRAQYHLLKVLTLTDENVQQYAHLSSMAPHMRGAVRTLKLSQLARNLLMHDKMAEYGEVSPMTRLMTAIPVTNTTFPSLTRLDLRLMDHELWTSPHIFKLGSITELRLAQCICADLTEFAELLCTFPMLKKLKVGGDLFLKSPTQSDESTEDPIKPRKPLRSRPAIEELRFRAGLLWGEVVSIGLTKWLIQESLHLHIHTFEITLVRREHDDVVAELLRLLGPRLEHLYIGLEPDVNQYGPMRFDGLTRTSLTLKHSSGLRTLGFWSPRLHWREDRQYAPLVWVPQLLGQVGSPSLEHIHYRFRAGSAVPSDLDALDWARMDTILCDRRFANLQRVTVEIFLGEKLKDHVEPHVRSRMPGLNVEGRDVLKFCHHLSGI